MEKLKKLITNNFIWYSMSSIFCAICSCCYIFEGEQILALCWACIAGCDIGLAYLSKEKKE